MARGSEVRYIQFYTDGSAARQMEPRQPKPRKKKIPKPRQHRQNVVLIRVDPLAVCAIVVAVSMLILMAVGSVQLIRANREKAALEDYIARLQEENEALEAEYRAGYDLEEVRAQAIAYGMVPVSQLETYTLRVEQPAEEVPELSFWEKVEAFFGSLFA